MKAVEKVSLTVLLNSSHLLLQGQRLKFRSKEGKASAHFPVTIFHFHFLEFLFSEIWLFFYSFALFLLPTFEFIFANNRELTKFLNIII